MTSYSLPANIYAEMAPLPAPLVDHLYRYWQRHHRNEEIHKMVKEVREKQRYAYVFLDSYVRNREKSSPRELRLSTELVRTTLGLYTPQKRPIPPKTFTYWIDSGYIRMKSKGYPEPDSAAALVVLRLLMETRSLLPSEPMNPEEMWWWCYAQSGPDEAIQAVPLSAVEDLPPYTLLWTGWAGAAWSESHTWMPIGDGFGAIRFTKPAITRPRQHTYELTALLRWKPDLEAQYQPQPGCELDMVNALEHLALVHLACNRVVSPSLWNKERLYAGQTGTGLLRRSR